MTGEWVCAILCYMTIKKGEPMTKPTRERVSVYLPSDVAEAGPAVGKSR